MKTLNHWEISQATNPNGRRDIKLVLHEIHSLGQWQTNGITYLEQYTRDNADSIKKGIPLCAEFLDDNDKEIPYGHGLTGSINNMPVFEDSVQVGDLHDWSIEDIEQDGVIHRCLCATGYINESRYPKFVKWIEDEIANGAPVCGSVEFVGTKENDGEIIYDGGWKEKGRIPMIYDYSGYCILSVKPADSAAVLLELNQSKLEVTKMNEEMKTALDSLKDSVISAFKETKTLELNEQVKELEGQVSELNTKIEELNADVASKEEEISVLNERCESTVTDAKSKEAELNSEIERLNGVVESQTAELNEMKKQNKVAELNSTLAGYSDEQKGYAKKDIDIFNADPVGCGIEINEIVTKINAASYEKIRKDLEVNSAKKNDFDDTLVFADPIVKEDESTDNFDDIF